MHCAHHAPATYWRGVLSPEDAAHPSLRFCGADHEHASLPLARACGEKADVRLRIHAPPEVFAYLPRPFDFADRLLTRCSVCGWSPFGRLVHRVVYRDLIADAVRIEHADPKAVLLGLGPAPATTWHETLEAAEAAAEAAGARGWSATLIRTWRWWEDR
ncbi:hypothetical protein HN937_30315 [Candidatus Poribacteria bacterium]|jgi:hypothetical protein|nr:hypothetical protein [Candidatus Poribacteria bacterium]